MYRKFPLLFFMVLLLMALFIGSCSEETDKSSTKDFIEVTDVFFKLKIDSLRNIIKEGRINTDSLQTIVNDAIARCESVNAENQALKADNGKLKAQLAQVRDEVIPAMLKSYDESYALQQVAYKRLEGRLKSTNSELSTVQSKYSVIQADNVRLKNDLSNSLEWNVKWKNDAHRSFIKVMFGAGKAPTPDVPTPQLE